MPNKKTFVIDRAASDTRLDRFLASQLSGEFSRTEIQKMIKEQGVLIDGKKCTQINLALKEGNEVVLDILDSGPSGLVGESIPLDIIFEDESLLVVNKPAGMVVHPGAGNHSGTLVHALVGAGKELSSEGEEDRPGIVHRLDKETSGLMLIAKSNNCHRQLAEAFSSRHVHKEYRSVVEGKVEYNEGRVEASLSRDPKQPTKRAVVVSDKAKDATTDYKVIERFNYSTYLSIHPLTGRTHQIRVHMAHLGHPVLGDTLYSRHEPMYPLALHAYRLQLEHPITKKALDFVADLPPIFLETLEKEKNR